MRKNKLKLYSSTYINDDSENLSIYSLDKNLYIGGTASYIITKNGARKMIEYIKENGIKHAIDNELTVNDDLNICETRPWLSYADWVDTYDANVNSDIQRNFDAFNFSSFVNNQKLSSNIR